MTLEFDTTRGGDRVVFGTNGARALVEGLNAAGARRALFVTTAGRAKSAARMDAMLGDKGVGVFDRAVPHVPIAVAEEARRQARRLDADWLVAVGGGSAIGLAKAVALDQQVHIAAVPTTYAGSEMTSIYGLTEADRKTTGRDPRVKPRLVVYDPAFTHGLPVPLALTSAFNAMAHAVEALYAPGVDPLTVLAAEDAIRRLAGAVPALVAEAEDPGARAELLYGAHLAGTCLESATMGLHHKLCHVLGGSFGTPHATTHTLLLPHVLHFNREDAPEACAGVARALGQDRADPAGALFDLVHRLLSRVGVPTTLAGLGVTEHDLDAAVDIALAAPYRNPRKADRDGLRALLGAAYHGRRPGSASSAGAAASVEAAGSGAGSAGVDAAAGPSRTSADGDELAYLAGFGSAMQTEALPGALPRSQNSPRRAPYGLYAECLNGTPFTQRRAENRRAWMYRIRPSLMQSRMQPVAQSHIVGRFDGARVVPDLVRWKPLPIPDGGHRVDFLDGLRTIGGAGDPDLRSGLAIHAYAANADMSDRCFCDADGDLLIVPERGAMRVQTEYGWLAVRPGEIVVIQRGMKFSVALPEGVGRGWVLEIFGAHFRLPERGPIGANGLADERHFSSPVAAFEDRACPGYEVMVKHGGELFRCTREHSPYDVVAWHGNYAPYKYDLAMFNTMGTVSFDHPDPSILTVLTSPLDDHGANLADFAVFPGRWDVAEHSFRPPYYHRNIATEFNGIVKIDEPYLGFDQGVCFLTPAMTPHGISGKGYLGAIEDSGAGSDQPRRLSDDSLWIMFESALGIRLTAWAMDNGHVDEGYHELWKDMPVTFRRG